MIRCFALRISFNDADEGVSKSIIISSYSYAVNGLQGNQLNHFHIIYLQMISTHLIVLDIEIFVEVDTSTSKCLRSRFVINVSPSSAKSIIETLLFYTNIPNQVIIQPFQPLRKDFTHLFRYAKIFS